MIDLYQKIKRRKVSTTFNFFSHIVRFDIVFAQLMFEIFHENSQKRMQKSQLNENISTQTNATTLRKTFRTSKKRNAISDSQNRKIVTSDEKNILSKKSRKLFSSTNKINDNQNASKFDVRSKSIDVSKIVEKTVSTTTTSESDTKKRKAKIVDNVNQNHNSKKHDSLFKIDVVTKIIDVVFKLQHKSNDTTKSKLFTERSRSNSTITFVFNAKNNQLSSTFESHSQTQVTHQFVVSIFIIVSIFVANQNQNTSSIAQTVFTKTFTSTSNVIHVLEHKSENVIVEKLNMWTSRYYMIFLFKNLIDESIKKIFSNMKFSHKIYKSLLNRVRINYKAWKMTMIKATKKWDQLWIFRTKRKRDELLTEFTTHKQIKRQLMREFDSIWLEDVFRFAISIIELKNLFE